jgi:XRE family transcriptional regulator, master regulator for biofilm formation
MLGTYIQRLRKNKNITLSQLAKRTNISKSYLSNIERNIQTNPSIGILFKLAIALDADIQMLIESSDSISNLNRSSELALNDGELQKRADINESNIKLLEEIRSIIENSKEIKDNS